jgi:hypothetical protein
VSDEIDHRLRRLFVETQSEPGDDAFVAAVASRVAWDRRLRTALLVCAAAALSVAVIALAPFVVAAGNALAAWPAQAIAPFGTFVLSPVGWALSIALGILAIVRAGGWVRD